MLIRMCIAVIVYVSLVGGVYACDPNSFGFGKSIEKIATQYKLDETDVGDGTDTEIPIRGIQLCNDIEPSSVARLVFVGDTFVQVKIEHTGDANLMKYAEKHLGEPAKITKKDGVTPNMQQMWNDKKGFMAVYWMGSKNDEYLEITSSDDSHKNLLNDFHLAQEKQMTGGGKVGE